MKLLIIKFIGLMIQSGGKTPPPPPNFSKQEGYQPDGPKLPIDGELWILLVIGLAFGFYILYRRNQATSKAS